MSTLGEAARPASGRVTGAAMIPAGWKQLGTGGAAGTLLAVDFDSARTEPGLGDLAPMLGVPYAMVRPAPPRIADGRATGSGVVDDWVRLIRDHRIEVRAVLGYCAGGALACATATGLAGAGGRPAVVLLDPEQVDGSMILHQYTRAIGQFADLLDESELADLVAHGRAVCEDPDLTGAARELPRRYGELATVALAAVDADEEFAAEMTDRFARYVEYLVASWQVGYAGAADDVLTIVSRTGAPPAGLGGRFRRVDAEHEDLLLVAEVATEVRRALGALDGGR